MEEICSRGPGPGMIRAIQDQRGIGDSEPCRTRGEPGDSEPCRTSGEPGRIRGHRTGSRGKLTRRALSRGGASSKRQSSSRTTLTTRGRSVGLDQSMPKMGVQSADKEGSQAGCQGSSKVMRKHLVCMGRGILCN